MCGGGGRHVVSYNDVIKWISCGFPSPGQHLNAAGWSSTWETKLACSRAVGRVPDSHTSPVASHGPPEALCHSSAFKRLPQEDRRSESSTRSPLPTTPTRDLRNTGTCAQGHSPFIILFITLRSTLCVTYRHPGTLSYPAPEFLEPSRPWLFDVHASPRAIGHTNPPPP